MRMMMTGERWRGGRRDGCRSGDERRRRRWTKLNIRRSNRKWNRTIGMRRADCRRRGGRRRLVPSNCPFRLRIENLL